MIKEKSWQAQFIGFQTFFWPNGPGRSAIYVLLLYRTDPGTGHHERTDRSWHCVLLSVAPMRDLVFLFRRAMPAERNRALSNSN